MSVGARIKAAREAAGISQEHLGSLCGTTKQTIYKYETGLVTNIPMDRLARIASSLGTSPAYLMGWDETTATIVPDDSRANEFVSLFNQLTDEQQDMMIRVLKGLAADK